jgi:hypothetical protein
MDGQYQSGIDMNQLLGVNVYRYICNYFKNNDFNVKQLQWCGYVAPNLVLKA